MAKGRKARNRNLKRNGRPKQPTGRIKPSRKLPPNVKRATSQQVEAAHKINQNNTRIKDLQNLAREVQKNVTLTALLAETQKGYADSTKQLCELATINLQATNDKLFSESGIEDGVRISNETDYGNSSEWFIIDDRKKKPGPKQVVAEEELDDFDDDEDDEDPELEDDFEDEDEFEDEEVPVSAQN